LNADSTFRSNFLCGGVLHYYAAKDEGLKAGVNTYAGKVTYEAVAVSQNKEYRSLDELL